MHICIMKNLPMEKASKILSRVLLLFSTYSYYYSVVLLFINLAIYESSTSYELVPNIAVQIIILHVYVCSTTSN